MQPFPVHTFDHSAKWAEAGRIKAHRSHITVVSFSPDRNYLASGDQDGYVLVRVHTIDYHYIDLPL